MKDLIHIGDGGETLELGAFSLKKTGLVVKGTPSFTEWEQCGTVLKRIEGAVQWWIGDWLNFGEKAYGEKYSQALSATDFPLATLENYAYVAQNIQPSRRHEDLGFSVHSEAARLPTAQQQDDVLARAIQENLSQRDVRQVVKQLRRGAKLEAAIWPDGKHGVILMDPPWRPDEGLLDPTREIENQYPTMTVEELCAMRPQVDAIAADDCVLMMWTTAQKIGEAIEVLNTWGFVVKSGAVWIKNSIGMGYWFRSRHELLILATRGAPMTPLEHDRVDSVLEAPRRGHSEKPDELYTVIERMFPSVPKVEVFARARREGWGYATNEPVLRPA